LNNPSNKFVVTDAGRRRAQARVGRRGQVFDYRTTPGYFLSRANHARPQ
jgi:hypothetical protein